MKPFLHFLAVTLLATTSLTLGDPEAKAGRVGGPASEMVTLPAVQSAYFDVAFTADAPAVVTIAGSGTTDVDLYVYDDDGHVTPGVGFGDRKTAALAVYRAGFFRIEVRNLGPVANTVVVGTN